MIQKIINKIKSYLYGKSVASFEIKFKDGTSIVVDDIGDIYNVIKYTYKDLIKIVKDEFKNEKYSVSNIVYNWGMDYYLGNAVEFIIKAGKEGDENLKNNLLKAAYFINEKIKLIGDYSDSVKVKSMEYHINKVIKVINVSAILAKILVFIYEGMYKDALELVLRMVALLNVVENSETFKKNADKLTLSKKLELCDMVCSKDVAV